MQIPVVPTVLAALIATGPAVAGFENGHSLKAHCTAQNLAGKAVCLGYVVGVHDALTASRFFCSPETARAGDIRDIVVAYLRQNSERLDFAADTLVILALTKAHPCN